MKAKMRNINSYHAANKSEASPLSLSCRALKIKSRDTKSGPTSFALSPLGESPLREDKAR